jgi:hypothetical protein
VFEHLRQIKLHKKQLFTESLGNLTGILETRSEQAKEAIRNSTLDLTKITMIGIRQRRLNTERESYYENSKKLNVDEVTILEPCDNEILSQIMQSDNIYHRLILLMKLDTQTYYNIRTILGMKVN